MFSKKNIFRLIGYFLFIILSFQCTKNEIEVNKQNFINDDIYALNNVQNDEQVKIPISYSKLEIFLGKDFIPIYFKISNVDNDIDEEFVIAYKGGSESLINIAIFDILHNDALRKIYSYNTNIDDEANFSLIINNLLYQNDIFLIIEGRTVKDKHVLILLTYTDNKFRILGDFVGSYSTIINFEEKESSDGKYFILDDIVVIDKALSSTNTSIQKKDVYKWSYDKEDFINVESSQIVSSDISSIEQSILYSSEKYFSHIKGFWYPEEYRELIKEDNLDPQKYNKNNIEFIQFYMDTEKKVSINYGDYIDKYSIRRISKLGGQKPGLRLSLVDNIHSSKYYPLYLDVHLVEPTILNVKGPKQFQQKVYIKLPKPFIEYVNEKNEIFLENDFEKLYSFLTGSFLSKDGKIEIVFKNDNFTIKKEMKVEEGVLRFKKEDKNYFVSFLYNSKNTILKDNYFLINIYKNDKTFIITPVDINFQDIKIRYDDGYTFIKNNNTQRP